MADSAPMDLHPRPQEDSPPPQKIPKLDNPGEKLDKPGEESKTTTKYGRLRRGHPDSDKYIQQYLMFHYDFYSTEGFGIDWDKFDFFFIQCKPCDGAPRISLRKNNEELVEEITLSAITKHNEENGTNIVLVEPIEANYGSNAYMEFWITFWGKDISLISPESKIYQANVRLRGETFWLNIFRVKPTAEEMAANPINVPFPIPYLYDFDKPIVVFSLAGDEDDPVPGTPYTFKRVPHPKKEDDETEVGIETESDVK